jgi:tyrosine-protein phosphatase non-receptor type 9
MYNIFLPVGDTVLEDEGDLLDTADEIIYENFGPNKGNRWMSANELQQYISGKDTGGLSSEYFALKNEPLFDTSNMFKLSHNLTKNRYKDVVCYDSTRVVLNAIPGQEGSDYIHANYVSGYNKPQSTILTQGPLKRTVNDFWRMLWEKEVFVIVMATKCVEMAKLKCAQYWPDGEEAALYGDVSVRVVKSQTHSAYELRELSATRKGITRTLMHYQFLAWPDYGVPSNGSDILDVLYAARHMQESFSDYVGNPHRHPVHGPPMVIHCSAGIGRSGTFAALDYCIDELRMTNKVNVQNSVRILRQQRAFSIQTDEQYRFCYQTVLEYALYLKSAMKM